MILKSYTKVKFQKVVLRSYQQKEQEEELKVLVDGIEMTLPTEEELYAMYEAEAARLELTVDYYIAEFV